MKTEKHMTSSKLVKNRKNVIKTLICALTAMVCTVGVLFGMLPSGAFHKTEKTALAVEADGFAAFAEGSTYSFTDREKFLAYRSQVLADNDVAAPTDDTTTVTVDSSAARGSQKNPYVINSFNTWKTFADEMGKDPSVATNMFGAGKYYVLATDLDFSKSSTIRPTAMWTFAGTLYGLGHTIKNYNLTEMSSSTDTGFAMFRYAPWTGTKSAEFADLNLEYNYTTSSTSSCYIGGFFGFFNLGLNLTVLNCHVIGTVSSSQYIENVQIGGMVGMAANWTDGTAGDGKLYFYRCSSKLTVVGDLKTAFYVGGIIGGEWQSFNSYYYDCYCDVNVTIESSFKNNVTEYIAGCGVLVGGCSAAKNSHVLEGKLEIVRCSGKSEAICGPNTWWCWGSLFTFGNDGSTSAIGTVLIRDCYVYGSGVTLNSNNYNRVDPWAVAYQQINNKSVLCDTKYNSVDAARVYWAGKTGGLDATWSAKEENNVHGYYGEEVEVNALWTSAKADDRLSSNIWTKTDLGTSYTYTIANSPVRNRKFDDTSFDISFYNLKQSGSTLSDEAIAGKSAESYTYTASSLSKYLGADPVSPNSNYVFRGWTTDKTGATAPDRSLDVANYYGDIKVYAVWELQGVTPAVSQSGGTLNGDTNTYEAESGGAGVVISAGLTFPSGVSSNDFNVTYNWWKNNTVDSSLGSGNAIHIGSSSQNGTYSFGYTVRGKESPLVMATGVCNDSIKVEITGKATALRSFDLTSPAYAGATLDKVTFNLVMVDGNTPIAGKAVWKSPSFRVSAGTNQTEIIFTPTNTAYKQMTVPVEFEATRLTLTFRVPDIQNSDLVVNIEYAQSYSAQQIVEMFEAAYAKKIEEDRTFEISVNNRTPMLDGIEIGSYNVAFQGALEPKTITVTFTEPKSYGVVLDYGYDDRVENTTAYWGQLIPSPAVNRGEEWVLDGWFITENNVPTITAWDFSSDRVTSDLKLTAKWTRIVLTLESIEVIPRSSPFTVPALTKIEDLGITVNATYSSTASDEPIVRTIPLKVGNNDGYEVRVNGILNGELHVSTTSIVVSYQNQTETVDITVTPISLDGYRGQINFPACTKDYTGSPLEIDPLRVQSLPEEVRPYVTKIEITYQKGGLDIDKSKVVEQGQYTAIATFTVDPDYTLSPIQTRFTISPPRLAVTVSWSAEAKYTYTGSPQHPVATLTYSDEHGSGTLSESQFDYLILTSGNSKSDGINAGNYTVTVVLAESVESFYKLSEGLTPKAFTIDKMKVAKPTPTQTSFEYTGSEITFILNGLDSSYMSTTGDSVATDVKSTPYALMVTLDNNHEWTEGGSTAIYNWTITKAKIDRPSFEGVSVEYNGLEQSVAGELYGFDDTKMVITAGGTGKNAGTYTARITPNGNYTWDNESTPVSVNWTISKKKLTVDWEVEDTYEKNGTTRFSPKVTGFGGLAEGDNFNPATDASLVRYKDGDKNTVGSYIVTISELRTSWAANYDWSDDLGKGYRIIEKGADPDDPNNPVVPDPSAEDPFNPGNGGGNGGNGDGNGGNGGNGGGNGGGGNVDTNPPSGGLPANLPLWQLIVGGVSVLLILVFATKITQVRGRTKRAKQAVAANSFGGFALLAAGPWLGLPQIGWTAISLALLGLAAILFIVYLVLNKKCLAAEAVAAETEKRRQAEREEEKEEERRRRDEEFKIMMANMMGNVQAAQPFSGGDIKELVGEVVSSIMPAMQALPAPSAEMQQMLEQQQQMIEALMNNQQQMQALPAPDNERFAELEERMAEQQRLADERLAQQQAMMLEQQRMAEERIQAERAEAQRREEEARKVQQEMMLRQEEMFRRMMEREVAPAATGEGGSNSTNSFVYEVEEEKLSIDRLTLAEAYEAMNDNLKKLFDELVAYVTAKPETAESDGKYAISFKYRAKALFKLVIKRGIPTINYSTEGEQLRQIKRDAAAGEGLKVRFKLSELQIMDSSTFDVAKEVIKACMQQIDKDIEYIKAQKAAKRRKQ